MSERQLPVAGPDGVRLHGRVIDEPPYTTRISKTAVSFAAIAWLSTLGLAFMLGRASVNNAPVQHSSSVPLPAMASTAAVVPTVTPSPMPTTQKEEIYPKYTSTIPKEFRGSWDEIVNDGCREREARYTLSATSFDNFEVKTNVERLKLISPTQIELSVTGYDEDKNQFNSKIGFRLLDGGKTLTGIAADSNLYRRCPS